MASYNEPMNLIEQHEDHHTAKYYVAVVALLAVLLVGVFGAVSLAGLAPTFNGDVDVATLAENPDAYNIDHADGAAYIIVALNNAKTVAKNVCFSVVFNFRGYDTMGESFILIAALSGSLCILRTPKHKKPEDEAAQKFEAKGAEQDG